MLWTTFRSEVQDGPEGNIVCVSVVGSCNVLKLAVWLIPFTECHLFSGCPVLTDIHDIWYASMNSLDPETTVCGHCHMFIYHIFVMYGTYRIFKCSGFLPVFLRILENCVCSKAASRTECRGLCESQGWNFVILQLSQFYRKCIYIYIYISVQHYTQTWTDIFIYITYIYIHMYE